VAGFLVGARLDFWPGPQTAATEIDVDLCHWNGHNGPSLASTGAAYQHRQGALSALIMQLSTLESAPNPHPDFKVAISCAVGRFATAEVPQAALASADIQVRPKLFEG
jgi:hypothetical protein